MLQIFLKQEPQRGVDIMMRLHTYYQNNALINFITPFFADGLIFIYPIFLIILYVYGIVYRKKQIKFDALLIFFGGIVALVMGQIIKIFVQKQRPDFVMYAKEELFLNMLPSMSFPSDHATLSFALAATLVFYGYRKQYQIFFFFGIFCLGVSCLMSLGRVMMGVHRPTDILMGGFLGILAGWIVSSVRVVSLFDGMIHYLISLEEKILSRCGWKQ